MTALGLNSWWNEPEYTQCDTAHLRGEFILTKLMRHDPERFRAVMADLYRKIGPMPAHMSAFEWQTILEHMGASWAEISDVLRRMGLSGR